MYAYLIPIVSMGGIGALLATVLVIADSRLRVEEDPRVSDIHDLLPGANCGACGLPGCHQFAEQVVLGAQAPTGCLAGGPDVGGSIGAILGIKVEATTPVKAVLKCLGGADVCIDRSEYTGLKDCRAAALVGGGAKGCVFGCLGFGGCVQACPFDAMHMAENGLPAIDEAKCTGCGLCVPACPRGLLTMMPADSKVIIGCSSPEKGKTVKDICARGCIGCVLCAKVCPTGAITMDGNLPVIDQDRCDNCGICIEKCPTNSLAVGRLTDVPDARREAAKS